MTRKRDILSHLTRDELLSAVDTLGLEVTDRRAKDPAIEALARAKRGSPGSWSASAAWPTCPQARPPAGSSAARSSCS